MYEKILKPLFDWKKHQILSNKRIHLWCTQLLWRYPWKDLGENVQSKLVKLNNVTFLELEKWEVTVSLYPVLTGRTQCVPQTEQTGWTAQINSIHWGNTGFKYTRLFHSHSLRLFFEHWNPQLYWKNNNKMCFCCRLPNTADDREVELCSWC